MVVDTLYFFPTVLKSCNVDLIKKLNILLSKCIIAIGFANNFGMTINCQHGDGLYIFCQSIKIIL